MTKHPVNRESGFLLPLVAILLAILSSFMINSLDFLDLRTDQQRTVETIRKLDKLQNALASFTQTNFRLPCAARADGQGTVTRRDDGLENMAPDSFCNTFRGIIPWKTLGLPQEYAKDGWGRYFTYGVAGNGVEPNALLGIYANCRYRDVWVFNMAGIDRNINPRKAEFCCSNGINRDLTIAGSSNLNGDPAAFPLFSPNTLLEDITGTDMTTFNPNYAASADTVAVVGAGIKPQQHFYYAIVSHGKNGTGAFLGPLTGGAARTVGPVSSSETTNIIAGANPAIPTFRWSPHLNPTQNYATFYFDDLVVFGTQATTWSRLGGPDQSCARPYTDYAPMEWELGG